MAGIKTAKEGLPEHCTCKGHGIMLGIVLIAVGIAIKYGMEFADILIIVGIVLLIAKMVFLKARGCGCD